MSYLLDTCLISELIAKEPNQQVLDWLDAQVPETLYLSIITIGEIAKGIRKMTASKRKESLTIQLHDDRYNDSQPPHHPAHGAARGVSPERFRTSVRSAARNTQIHQTQEEGVTHRGY